MVAFLTFVAIVSVLGISLFVRDQARRGRFRRARVAALDDAALQRIPAEVAGAAWSDTVDADTVKALLTRLVLEGKVEPSVREGQLALRLTVPRASLGGYERTFVNALFVSSETVDRSTLVRDRMAIDALNPDAAYHVDDLPEILAPKTFDLAAETEEAVMAEAHRLIDGTYFEPSADAAPVLFRDLLGNDKAAARPTRKVPNAMLWLYGLLLIFGLHDVPSDWERGMGAEPLMSFQTTIFVAAAAILHLGAIRLADRARRKVTLSLVDICLPLLPLLAIPLLACLRTGSPFLFALMYTGSLINVLFRARSTIVTRPSDIRERLQLAREQLARAIRERCDERWLPYVIAFGLGGSISGSVPAFARCGDVARWNELVGALLQPIVTRPSDDD